MWLFELRGENPLPKQRPRRGPNGKRLFTPKKTKDWERLVKTEIEKQATALNVNMDTIGDRDLGIIVHFIRKNRVKADTDNLVKAVKDSLEGVLWKNDKIIKGESVYMSYNKDNPGFILLVTTYEDWLAKMRVEQFAGNIIDQEIPPKQPKQFIRVYVNRTEEVV